MDTQSFYTRQMLLQYGKQLIAARRLARYDRLLGKTSPVGTEGAAEKRRSMVERIAREIVENLIFSGSDNPVVHDVHRALAEALGERVIFRYPPADLDFQIFRLNAQGEEAQVSLAEKQAIIQTLWQVTLRIVDETTL